MIRPVNRGFGAGSRPWLAAWAALVAASAGCGGSADAGAGSRGPTATPTVVAAAPAKATAVRGGKARLARNRPPEYLDARIGK